MTNAKRRGLGRGLGSLIPTAPPADAQVSESTKGVTAALPTVSETEVSSKVKPNKSATSGIKAHGDGENPQSSTSVNAATSRPVDVFFPADTKPANKAGGKKASSAKEDAEEAKAKAAWDSAAASGRLGLRSTTSKPRTRKPDVVSRETTDELEPLPPTVSAEGLVPVPGATFAELSVDSIGPNPQQPRTVFDENDLEELANSIKEIGVLQPVVVRPDPDQPGKYQLIMGERRWRASQLAGADSVPAIIRSTDDADLLRDALLENLHRSQLNPLEEAAAYRQLLDDFGCTHEELATRIARSRPQISNTLRLLKLPPLVQRRVAAGVLSAGHARALLGLEDGAAIERLAQRIVAEGLSVRAVEEIVSLAGTEKPKTARNAKPSTNSPEVTQLVGRLSDYWETRVKVQMGRSKGKMTIEFASPEDLNRILAVMAPGDPGLGK